MPRGRKPKFDHHISRVHLYTVRRGGQAREGKRKGLNLPRYTRGDSFLCGDISPRNLNRNGLEARCRDKCFRVPGEETAAA